MFLDCDWSVSVQLFQTGVQKSVTTVKKSVTTVQKSVTNRSDWLKTQRNSNHESITSNIFRSHFEGGKFG